MTFAAKIQPYKVYEISWVVAPTDKAVGIKGDGSINTFTILDGPDDLAVRLNSAENDLLEYIEGVDGIVITEIYLTSAQPNESCKIYVAWDEQ